MATIFSGATGQAIGIRVARENGGTRAAGAERAVARMLGTARKRDGMVVRTVAGLPVSIGGDTRALGFSNVTRVVRR
jgi:hypothetical protein